MSVLKQNLSGINWTIMAFLSVFGYMRIVLDAKPKPAIGFTKLILYANGIYNVRK